MDTKAAFEKWFDENMYLAGQCFCTEQEKRRMLKAWTASREAIEIELPEEYHSDSWLGNGCCDDYANTKIAECRKAITSHRIGIKGKTS